MDDRPLQEYGVRSMLSIGFGVPGGIVDLRGVVGMVSRMLPRRHVPFRRSNSSTPISSFSRWRTAHRAQEIARARRLFETENRVIAGSAYLGAIVPESADTHNVLGLSHAQQGELDPAVQEFRRALELEPDDAAAHWHIGAALASRGAYAEATTHLARSVELDPRNGQAHNDLGLVFALQGRFDEGVDHLERAVALDPRSDAARRNLAQVRQQRERAAGQP